MPSLRECWQAGFRALHIEESIGNAFADFAPYAAADEQRVVVTRHASQPFAAGIPLGPASMTASSSSLVMEENGSFAVQARDANVGGVSFSTTGQLQLDAAVRLPLPLPLGGTATTTHTEPGEDERVRGEAHPPLFHPAVLPAAPQLRFSDLARPVVAPAAAGSAAGCFGQVEVDAAMPEWDANRQSCGARIGNLALRFTRTFAPAATATAQDATIAALQNSGTLSDEDEPTRAARLERARWYQRTLDLAVCVPLGSSVPYAMGESSAAAAVGAEAVVVQTLRGQRINLRTSPWALTCGVQMPVDIGDTLIGVSLQNDRATSTTLPFPGVEWAVAAPPPGQTDQVDKSGEQDGTAGKSQKPVACVPTPLRSETGATTTASSTSTEKGSSTAPLPVYCAIPSFSFRLLVVQTLASHTLERGVSPSSSLLVNSMGESMIDSTLNQSAFTHLVSSYDWRKLPTLVGVNVGLDRERLRLSAASILHDGAIDLELSGVVDVTPWTPRMPTLLKVGYNNVGRIAAGITSLFYGSVTATLGVHMAPGEQAKFGVEVKF